MAQTGEFTKETLFLGVLAASENLLNEALNSLIERYGPIKKRSEATPFIFTDYYNEEMGGVPLRSYHIFEEAVDPSRLAEIKTTTNEVEHAFSIEGKRRVNLDPGLLTLGKPRPGDDEKPFPPNCAEPRNLCRAHPDLPGSFLPGASVDLCRL